MAALVGGFFLGMFRLIAEIKIEYMSGWLYKFASMNFLYFGVYLFLICIGLMIAISLLSSPPSEEKIKGLTYATTIASDKAKSRASWNYRDVILSVVILIIIAFVLLYFSPVTLSR